MNWLNRLFKNQKGVFLVFTAVLLPIIFACAGLAMDLGSAFAYKSKLQNAADAAALAGAKSFSINKGEEEGKDNEKDGEHPKSDETAMKYANINYQKDISEAHTDLKIRQKDGVYYYRVYLKDYVPVTFMRLLGVGPTMEVSVDAIATVPQNGDNGSGSGSGGGELLNVGSSLSGSFYNGNNDHNSTVRGPTFEGNVVVYDKSKYDEYKKANEQWGGYYFYKPDAAGMKVTDAIDQKLYTEPTLGTDYDKEKTNIDNEIKDIFEKNKLTVKEVGGNQNCTIPVGGENTNYYKVSTDSSGNLSMSLKNPPGNQDEPVYIYVSNSVGFLKINLQENITRPVIIYYEKNANVQFTNNNHDFRGVLCAPNAWVSPFNFENGSFSGSIWASGLELNTNHGKFNFEGFGNGVFGGGGSGSGSTDGKEVKLKLVDGSGVNWN